MNTEIERKFIIPLEYHHLFLERERGSAVTQAYLSSSPECTVRLRISEHPELGKNVKMTVKGTSSEGGLVRNEWEWSMPEDTVRDMLEKLKPQTLTKTRHVVSYDWRIWEVDVMRVNEIADRPPNMWRYLVVAEYEAPTLEEVQGVPLPPWVGRDVTGDSAFTMANLTTEAARDLAWRKAYL